ncbi:WD40 repeat domain-containing protein [Streptomyces mirabilis]|uniref:WD40 repeat domain-containing protein n=1 Tax=Streptomyces mirabilis TaxID=68239 RepID=UPI0035D67B69
MRQGMRSARVTTFTSEPGRILWPTLARARSGQVVLLSSCEGQEIRRWDMFTGRMLWCSADAWSANALAVASPPGGNPVVAVATEDGVVRLDALTGAELDGHEMAADDTIWDVATGILPNGRAFIAGAGHCGFRVYRWDAATGEPLGPPLVGHTTCVKAVTAITLPDGTALIASEDEAGRILRWNAASGQPYGNPIHGPGDYNMQLVSLALNDGRVMLASLDMNGTLSRWDAVTGEPIGPLMRPGPETRLACATAAGGGVLFIAPYGGPIRLWDAVSGEVLGAPLPGTGPAALSCSDGSVSLATRAGDTEMTVRRLVDPPR